MRDNSTDHITLGGPAYLRGTKWTRRATKENDGNPFRQNPWPMYTVEVVKAVPVDTPDGGSMTVSKWVQHYGPYATDEFEKTMTHAGDLFGLRKSGVRVCQWRSRNNDKHIVWEDGATLLDIE